MGLLKNIEWTDDSKNTIVYRFDMKNDYVSKGSVLTVRSFTMGVSQTWRLQRPCWFSSHTQSPSFTPCRAAVFGLTYTSGSG